MIRPPLLDISWYKRGWAAIRMWCAWMSVWPYQLSGWVPRRGRITARWGNDWVVKRSCQNTVMWPTRRAHIRGSGYQRGANRRARDVRRSAFARDRPRATTHCEMTILPRPCGGPALHVRSLHVLHLVDVVAVPFGLHVFFGHEPQGRAVDAIT